MLPVSFLLSIFIFFCFLVLVLAPALWQWPRYRGLALCSVILMYSPHRAVVKKREGTEVEKSRRWRNFSRSGDWDRVFVCSPGCPELTMNQKSTHICLLSAGIELIQLSWRRILAQLLTVLEIPFPEARGETVEREGDRLLAASRMSISHPGIMSCLLWRVSLLGWEEEEEAATTEVGFPSSRSPLEFYFCSSEQCNFLGISE